MQDKNTAIGIVADVIESAHMANDLDDPRRVAANALEAAGFIPHSSFESEYAVTRQEARNVFNVLLNMSSADRINLGPFAMRHAIQWVREANHD